MPEHEDPLGAESLLGLDDVLGEVLAVVRDLGPHVVNEEGLGEEVFVVRVGHCLEMEGHGSTTLDITDLVPTGRRVAVSVEELGNILSILREQRVVKSSLPLLVEVHNMVSLWAEKTAELLVAEHLVKDVDLINGGLSTLVSDARGSQHAGSSEVNFPERSMGEHHEGEATPGDEGAGPHVVRAVQSRADLVQIVASTHAPFPVVRAPHV